MRYAEFLELRHLTREQLVALAHGTLLADPPSGFLRLPTPPFMILSRITEVIRHGEDRLIVGEQDVRFDDWFFQGHFIGDPVQPGCLVLDTAWMVVGLFIALRGGIGQPRALGCDELRFSRAIRPHDERVRYEARILRSMHLKRRGAHLVTGDVRASVGPEEVCRVRGARFGLFQGIAYPNYPAQPSVAVPADAGLMTVEPA